MNKKNIRTYKIPESCIFKKNNEEFGDLSNMASNYPIYINKIRISSSEALYQACKFPDNIELQLKILNQKSPFIAKQITKGKPTRKDWMQIRINVMRWCLKLKLANNLFSFGSVLSATREQSIVENSTKDQFWGAHQINKIEYKGINALGRLLMELREKYYTEPNIKNLLVIPPLAISDFTLLGNEIPIVNYTKKYDFKRLEKLDKQRRK